MNMTRHSRSRSRGKRTSSTASSARSTLLRPNVITAGAKSSATVWKTAAKFFAAPTARGKVAKTGCGIASKPCWNLHGERSEEHTSELQSRRDLVCRLLLEKKKKNDS